MHLSITFQSLTLRICSWKAVKRRKNKNKKCITFIHHHIHPSPPAHLSSILQIFSPYNTPYDPHLIPSSPHPSHHSFWKMPEDVDRIPPPHRCRHTLSHCKRSNANIHNRHTNLSNLNIQIHHRTHDSFLGRRDPPNQAPPNHIDTLRRGIHSPTHSLPICQCICRKRAGRRIGKHS